jgi:ribosome-associated translation inhibitor RaiA
MSKLTIYNDAADTWQSILEQRASLLLASLGSSLPRIIVRFEEMPASQSMQSRFCCSVTSTSGSSRTNAISAEHPDGVAAIEGAMRRFRRQVERVRGRTGREAAGANYSYQTK